MFYSQFGEDKILNNIFKMKTSGLCIEVGANNGVDDSNSFFFEQIGWKCILVEPNPHLCKMIREKRNSLLYECAASNQVNTTILHVVDGAERSDGLSTISNESSVHDKIKSHGFTTRQVEVNTMTLDDILADAKINIDIDFISIDVEGHEYEVLKGFSIEKWEPTIILVEDNSNLEDDTVKKYLKKFGYVKFMRTGVNDWYAKKTNKQLVNIRSNVGIRILTLRKRLSKIPLLARLREILRLVGV